MIALNCKYGILVLISMCINTCIWSQESIKTNKIIANLENYSFPLDSTTFNKCVSKKELLSGNYYYDLNLNDSISYYLYNTKDINDGVFISGDKIDYANLYGKNLAIGYSKHEKYYLVYYVGFPNKQYSSELQIIIGTDFFDDSGLKIDISYDGEIIQFRLAEAYSSDETWVNTTFRITNFHTISTKTSYHEEDGIFRTENEWLIDLEKKEAMKH